MLTAEDLKEGMAVRIDGQIYKVLEAESKAGTAKLGGVVKTKLSRVGSGHLWEPHFRPQERLEEVQLERRNLEFVFAAGDTYTFMSPETFEQIELDASVVGPSGKFLRGGMQVGVEFFAGDALNVILPDTVDILVKETTPSAHAQQESAWKQAKLENGIAIQLPMFVGPGEVVRVDTRTGRYIERVRAAHKRGA